jgi:DNA-binding NtrC family response regulator
VAILVAEDDVEVGRSLSKILASEGYSVKWVENGEQAIFASYEQFFNVALIDIRLPDMDGIDLLKKLRKTEPEMVKIIITGYPSLENAVEAVNRGADGYILKPFDPEKLLAMIKKHLGKQKENVKFDEKKVAEYIETRHHWMFNTQPPKKSRRSFLKSP